MHFLTINKNKMHYSIINFLIKHYLMFSLGKKIQNFKDTKSIKIIKLNRHFLFYYCNFFIYFISLFDLFLFLFVKNFFSFI